MRGGWQTSLTSVRCQCRAGRSGPVLTWETQGTLEQPGPLHCFVPSFICPFDPYWHNVLGTLERQGLA